MFFKIYLEYNHFYNNLLLILVIEIADFLQYMYKV